MKSFNHFYIQVFNVFKALSPFSAFGNVHGVKKASNVTLSPHLLEGTQEYAKQQLRIR